MKYIKLGLLLLFLALFAGLSVDSIPFDIKIIMFGALFVLGTILIGGVIVAAFMDAWEAMEKDRNHGP